MSSYTRLTAIALTAAALAVAGCGGDDSSPTAAKKPTPAGMPVKQYVTQVAGIGQLIDDARSEYFHADHTRAAIKRSTADVQAAYANAANQITALAPPAVAADLHEQLVAAWEKRSGQLEKVLAAKPLDTSRIDDLMAATDRDVSTTELYTLPQ